MTVLKVSNSRNRRIRWGKETHASFPKHPPVHTNLKQALMKPAGGMTTMECFIMNDATCAEAHHIQSCSHPKHLPASNAACHAGQLPERSAAICCPSALPLPKMLIACIPWEAPASYLQQTTPRHCPLLPGRPRAKGQSAFVRLERLQAAPMMSLRSLRVARCCTAQVYIAMIVAVLGQQAVSWQRSSPGHRSSGSHCRVFLCRHLSVP